MQQQAGGISALNGIMKINVPHINLIKLKIKFQLSFSFGFRFHSQDNSFSFYLSCTLWALFINKSSIMLSELHIFGNFLSLDYMKYYFLEGLDLQIFLESLLNTNRNS